VFVLTHTDHWQKASFVMNMGKLMNLSLLQITVSMWAMLVIPTGQINDLAWQFAVLHASPGLMFQNVILR